jgi:hypothetical protein
MVGRFITIFLTTSALALSRELKEDASAEERAQVTAHWPFDDMDQDEYM